MKADAMLSGSIAPTRKEVPTINADGRMPCGPRCKVASRSRRSRARLIMMSSAGAAIVSWSGSLRSLSRPAVLTRSAASILVTIGTADAGAEAPPNVSASSTPDILERSLPLACSSSAMPASCENGESANASRTVAPSESPSEPV
jgi:hypothetical protein